jgi:hypothetical protein
VRTGSVEEVNAVCNCTGKCSDDRRCIVVLKLIKSVHHTAIIKERRQRQSEFAPIVNFLFFFKLLNNINKPIVVLNEIFIHYSYELMYEGFRKRACFMRFFFSPHLTQQFNINLRPISSRPMFAGSPPAEYSFFYLNSCY